LKARALVLTLLVAIPALALAALILNAHGRGAARSEDGRIGHFNFNVTKTINGTQITRSGKFVLENTDPETRNGVRIFMRELRDMTIEERVARFQGPGSIRWVTREGRVVEKSGSVRVLARDTRREGTGLPDRIAVTFLSESPHFTYAFEGNVTDGDVVVSRTER
jgi:hypothetical protein